MLSEKVVVQENPIFSYENSLVIFCYKFENGLLCHSRKIPYFPNSLVIRLLLYSYVSGYTTQGKSHIFLCDVLSIRLFRY